MAIEQPIRQAVASKSSIIAVGGALQAGAIMSDTEHTQTPPLLEHSQPLLALGDYQLTVWERMVSACTGAILTSLLVTPFDVVKTRLQATNVHSSAPKPFDPVNCPKCADYIFNNGLMEHKVPKLVIRDALTCTHAHRPQFSGTFDALIKISRNEGVASLYNGLPPTLLMAVPATVLYFAAYDTLRDKLEGFHLGGVASPLLAGAGARTLAATAISPLELLRTKMQSINDPPNMIKLARAQVQSEGLVSLWRGLSPTLLRDVPFSAIYWVSVESIKTALRNPDLPDSGGENLFVSFVAGATSGMVAATVTTPFDVVKTRNQMIDMRGETVANRNVPTARVLRQIIQNDGPSGLFVGLLPRLAKVIPACAIMLSSYEYGKYFFASRHHGIQ